MANIFITGISTDVGKTLVSAIFIKALKADYWKPIQSGNLDFTDAHTVAHLIGDQNTTVFPHAYALNAPMSPHAAADLENKKIKIQDIIRPKTQNHLVIEGSGGLLVPLNKKHTIIDLINKDDAVILVSRNYLGSINHTLLSIEALKGRGFSKIALVFNGKENKSTEEIICEKGQLPSLGRVDQYKSIDAKIIGIYAQKFKPIIRSFLCL